jgi:hypothetical protein
MALVGFLWYCLFLMNNVSFCKHNKGSYGSVFGVTEIEGLKDYSCMLLGRRSLALWLLLLLS